MGNNSSATKGKRKKCLEDLIEKVPNMNINEIRDVYEDFKRHSRGKKRLTLKDFKKVYKAAFGEKAASLAEHIFHAFDVNGDGKVSFEEFLVGINMADNRANDRKSRLASVEWAFSVYDVDKSGTIDRNEMRSLVKAVYMLSTGQANVQAKSPEEFADELFDEIDVNHDGDITFEEFCRAAENNEGLIEMLMPAPDVALQ